MAINALISIIYDIIARLGFDKAFKKGRAPVLDDFKGKWFELKCFELKHRVF